MMSGMRKAPPISISSPRETTASRPSASVFSDSRTAAALLLTTVASSAPVSSHRSARRWSSRSPRPPLSRSNSSATGARMAATAASIASSGSSARPRLVCSTVPVRFRQGRSGSSLSSMAKALASAMAEGSTGIGLPFRISPRIVSTALRIASVVLIRPCIPTIVSPISVPNRRSTEGNLRSVMSITDQIGVEPTSSPLAVS